MLEAIPTAHFHTAQPPIFQSTVCSRDTGRKSVHTDSTWSTSSRNTLLHSHTCSMNVVPKGPQVGNKMMMPRMVLLFCIQWRGLRKDEKPPQETAGKWCRDSNPTWISWRCACNCFLYFLYFHQMRIYYFAITKNQMKFLIFKQPTFYKNQIGTRSQLCNPLNHRQKQLIQWKARAGWLARKIFKPTQGRHTVHRDYEEEQKLQLSSSSELSWERLQFASLSSATSCYNVHVWFPSYTASETVSPPHYEVT